MFMPRFRTQATHVSGDTAHKPSHEPVIGLALGGGSARGWAHIGVLRKLDEAGIRPSVVVGTSIGAVVGGAWASGKLDELQAFATSISKRSMLSMIDVSIAGGGLLGGDHLRRRLEEHFGDSRIEDLPVRYSAIATEISTGHEVWLTHGNLTNAMRASYALPGIFVPVQVSNRWLMDGAISNPVPVNVARALGAEMIIAVNLHTDVLGRSGVIHEHGLDARATAVEGLQLLPPKAEDEARSGLLASVYGAANRVRQQFTGAPRKTDEHTDTAAPRMLNVMLDAFNITQDRIARSRLAGDPPDVMIGPKIGGIGLSEFHRAEEAIAAGMTAAEKMLSEIDDIRLALSRRK